MNFQDVKTETSRRNKITAFDNVTNVIQQLMMLCCQLCMRYIARSLTEICQKIVNEYKNAVRTVDPSFHILSH